MKIIILMNSDFKYTELIMLSEVVKKLLREDEVYFSIKSSLDVKIKIGRN